MAKERWVAFVRGINVGGRNRVKMADLRDALESAGLEDVRTYIQSGNVVFDRPAGGDEACAAATIAEVLERSFDLTVPVVVRSLDDVERVAAAHPDAGGDVPPKWLVVFLLDGEPELVERADAPEPDRYAPDRWVVDGREVYATYPEGSGRSKLTIDVFERAYGVTATARNLSTLAAVVELGRGNR